MTTTNKDDSKTINLCELGNLLPVGIPVDNSRWERVFEFRPWTMKEERVLGKIRRESQGGSRSSFVSRVVAFMLKKLGPIDWDKADEPSKLLYLSKLTFGDFLYLFCYLRKEAIGNIIPFEILCPSCNSQFDFPADLDTLDIRSPHIPEEASPDCLQTTVPLRDGIMYSGQNYKDIIIRSTPWGAFMDEDPETYNDGAVKEALLKGSIVGLSDYILPEGVPKDAPFLLDDDSLDGITKKDLEFLTRQIDEVTFGPELVLQGKCPKCTRPFRQRLEWDYDTFFESSSQ